MYKHTPVDIKRIAHALGKATPNGQGYTCLCPAHNDRNPSLSVSRGNDGRMLLHCFAGCDFKSVLNAIQEKGLLPYRPYGKPESAYES